MPERQLRLLPPPRPLVDNLGAVFFQGIPKKPGVYRMVDGTGRIIYIGYSSNLRHRIFSYKNARPESVSRKTIRLVHTVSRIEWEECESTCHARLRENKLLRTHRPKFNSLNTYPQAHWFIGLGLAANLLTLRWHRDPEKPRQFGAFKSGCIRGYGALLRLLWLYLHPNLSPADVPRQLIQAKPPREFSFSAGKPDEAARLPGSIEDFLAGNSAALTGLLKHVTNRTGLAPFYQRWLETDLELLGVFYASGPERNCRLRQKNGIQEMIIAQEQLDDLLVLEK